MPMLHQNPVWHRHSKPTNDETHAKDQSLLGKYIKYEYTKGIYV